MSGFLGDPQTLEDVERQFHDRDGALKDKLPINNSILTILTKIQHDNPQPPRQQEPNKELKIKKELCLDTLNKYNNPIEFRKFQRDLVV